MSAPIPFKVTRPGILEIRGIYPASPVHYVTASTIQSFLVNSRSNTIEIFFLNGFPSKVIDIPPSQLTHATEVMSDFMSNKPKKTVVSLHGQDTLDLSIKKCEDILSSLDERDFNGRLIALEKLCEELPTKLSEVQGTQDTLVSTMNKLLESSREDISEHTDTENEVKADEPAESNLVEPAESNLVEASIAGLITALFALGLVLMILPSVH